MRRARAGAGRGRVRPDDARLPAAAAGAARRARDPLRRRRGAGGRRPHRAGVGDRALRRRARPARRRQVARRRAAARARHGPRRGDGRSRARRARRDVRRQSRVAAPPRTSCSTRVAEPEFEPRSEASASRSRRGSTRSRARTGVGESAASDRCSRSSSASRAATARPPSPRRRSSDGLVLLTCGTVRQRDPDPRPVRGHGRASSTRGLAILEERLRVAQADVADGRRRTSGASGSEGLRRGRRGRPTSTSRCGEGEFFTLLGPSGSGKTTTLRMIAGFEQPDAGTIRLGGEDVTAPPPVRARREHGLPGLRALPAHDRRRERRLRPAVKGVEARRAHPSGQRGARDGAARRLRRPQAGAALRRAAPARRARARDREPPEGARSSTSRSARST